DHVERFGEIGEHDSIAVSKYHFLAVPEGVVEALVVVHEADEPHPAIVEGVAIEDALGEFPRRSEAVKGAIDRRVARLGAILAARDASRRKLRAALAIGDRPPTVSRSRRKGERSAQAPLSAKIRRRQERVQRGLPDVLVRALHELQEEMGGRDALWTTTGEAHSILRNKQAWFSLKPLDGGDRLASSVAAANQ